MGFLSNVLPGVRDFRNPFVVGALWTTVGILWSWIVSGGDVLDAKLVREVNAILAMFVEPVRIGVFAFAVYLLGLVVKGVQDWIHNSKLRQMALNRLLAVPLPEWLTQRVFGPPNLTKNYLADAARERFADYPTSVHQVAHLILLREYELADVILTSRSPEQYQEYDRWRSEADFRNGVWLPLFLVALAIGVLAGGIAGPLLGLVGGAVSLALKLQGLDRGRAADQRLASAVYFDLASTPLFDSLLRHLDRRGKESANQWFSAEASAIAWTLDFLAMRKLGDLYGYAIGGNPTASFLRDVFGRINETTRDALEREYEYARYLLVAYGGVSWDGEGGRAKDWAIATAILDARRKISDWVAHSVEQGDFDLGDVTSRGVKMLLDANDIKGMRGTLSNKFWSIACRMVDSESEQHLERRWALQRPRRDAVPLQTRA